MVGGGGRYRDGEVSGTGPRQGSRGESPSWLQMEAEVKNRKKGWLAPTRSKVGSPWHWGPGARQVSPWMTEDHICVNGLVLYAG